MDLYTQVAFDVSRRLTLRYSSSFGLASKLYSGRIRPHIYAIYGMVRVADEIVDTYDGSDRAELLASFHAEVIDSLSHGYSTNPIVHAFCVTARQFAIDSNLIDPFFNSMQADLTQKTFTPDEYNSYIYGSAEVIGLMCLRVFCNGKSADYEALVPGARQLGSAYQKVNFLRDIRADYEERGRIYFPGISYGSFNDTTKQAIVTELTSEFRAALPSIRRLPTSTRRAVFVSYRYYTALLKKLSAMSAEQIKHERAHVSSAYKLWVFVTAWVVRP